MACFPIVNIVNRINNFSWIPKMSTGDLQEDLQHKSPSPLKNKQAHLLLTGLLLLLCFFIWHRIQAQEPRTRVAPIPNVVIYKAQKAQVPVYLDALGTVTPTYSVSVKTQINGQLEKIFVKEGQFVKKGELLAQIDDKPYQALLAQYEGDLIRDQALLANAQLDLARYQQLYAQDSISQQVLNTQQWLVKQYEGTVQADKGLIQTAKVNIQYSKITSPIEGRVGLRLVDPGNFVQVSDTTGLFVLNTLNPITVVFTLPEDNIPQIIQSMQKNKHLPTQAFNRTQLTLLEEGKLNSIDNQIDPTTGTLKLKAEFKNPNNILFPNQFVNIKLLVNTLKDAIVIPTSAILYGVKGTYVYTVTQQDNIAKMTPVVVGITTGDNTVITSGIVENTEVIIEGTDKLKDNTPVKISNAAGTKIKEKNRTPERVRA